MGKPRDRMSGSERVNRTTATCIAGMRSKTTTGIQTHFQRRPRPHEAEPFTRRVFVLGLGIFPRDGDGDRAQTRLILVLQ